MLSAKRANSAGCLRWRSHFRRAGAPQARQTRTTSSSAIRNTRPKRLFHSAHQAEVHAREGALVAERQVGEAFNLCANTGSVSQKACKRAAHTHNACAAAVSQPGRTVCVCVWQCQCASVFTVRSRSGILLSPNSRARVDALPNAT